MKSLSMLVLAGLLSASAAMAQTSSPDRSTTTPPAVSNPNNTDKTTAAPVPAQNSFTKKQVVSRLRKNGFTSITNVVNDKTSGIWHATATKSGQTVSVDVDYQGNITTH